MPHDHQGHEGHDEQDREPDDLIDGIASGVDSFDCAVPTRLGRHGMALDLEAQARYYDYSRARDTMFAVIMVVTVIVVARLRIGFNGGHG